MNNLKVFVLMAGLTGLVVAIGQSLGGSSGAMMALGLSAVMNIAMYWGSSSMVLRSYGARVVSAEDAPALYAMVDRLRQNAGLPMPVVAIAPQAQPNAFATGRNPANAVVCVTEGILKTLSPDELEGVIAHELAHIKNHDMLLSTIAATMAGAISNLAQMAFFFGGRRDDDEGGSPFAAIAMLIVGPIIAMLIQFAISRQREFKADAVGAQISGRPLSLASALQRLDAGAHRIPMHVSPSAASLAIVNPLAAFSLRGAAKWMSTHPPTEERVAALRALAGQQ
ncbi:MAG: zinc metalloprotease HtpX [Gemmatimonadaceae bacterium]|jgi:heat shock protein HtpX|nr:zinc metalloprotease HtpX [Gemmatimonadaceae bacterium]